MLENNNYLEHLFLDEMNRNTNNNSSKSFEEEKEDSGIVSEPNENINRMFFKRSNSMKCITENSSHETNTLTY